MPVRSSVGGATAAVSAFPKLQRGPNGNVWLMAADKVGTLVHTGASHRPGKHEQVGYHSIKLSQRKLTDFTGELKLSA